MDKAMGPGSIAFTRKKLGPQQGLHT
jgi:hypothetical protein